MFLVSPNSGLAITLEGELHNRADLIARLSAFHLSPDSSDASLILAAYEKWDRRCAEFLLGEFSFAIWDSDRRRLFCCRDHCGSRPFFYWTDGVRLAFSSYPLWLFRVPGIDRALNRAKVAAWGAGDGEGAHHRETFHLGVFSLPSATTLTFERGQLTTSEYWTPDIQSVSIPAGDEAAFETLRQLIFEAVECRLRGKSSVAAHLSGGLDSAALTAVAARYLGRSNRSLLALAAVLPEVSKPEFTDEREFIDEFRGYPNVDIEYVAPAGGGPFDRIDDPSRFASFPAPYTRRYLLDAMQDVAAQRGAALILSGSWGEAGPSTYGAGYYLELACRLNWRTLGHELTRLGTISGMSPVRMMAREMFNFIAPQRGQRGPDILLAQDIAQEADTPGGSAPRSYWPDHRRNQLGIIRDRMNSHASRPERAVTPVPMSLPFLDKRLLEFCLAVPGDMKVREGYQRHLLRRALDGILPPKIQWRTTKCAFSPDYRRRYLAQLGKAKDFVSAIRRNDPVRKVVDVDRIRHLLNYPDTLSGRTMALTAIPYSIYLICFLRQFAEFRP